MGTKSVITIGRQFGSGGREVGEKLAKQLGIPYFDKELILLAAQKSGMSPEILEEADEKATSNFWYSMSLGIPSHSPHSAYFYEMPVNDKLFLLQSEVIENAANNGPCVIVGRCADYVLRDHPNCAHVYVHADDSFRVKRIAALHSLDLPKAEELMRKTDKNRRSYYNYYTDKKWGDARNYHLCIDSSILGTDAAVELIKDYVALRESHES